MEEGIQYEVRTFPHHREIEQSFETMILSASGWRKVFAWDRDEHSRSPLISPADAVLSCAAALIFSRHMRSRYPEASTLLIATDSRDTGPAVAQFMIRTLLHERWNLQFLGISAVPEVIAYNMLTPEIHGGIYISASHNPSGYNGFKFFISAGVVGGDESRELIDAMESLISDEAVGSTIAGILSALPYNSFQSLLPFVPKYKSLAEEAYRQFISAAAGGSENTCQQDVFFSRIREGVKNQPLGLVYDFNGSARGTSIDQRLLNSLDIPVLPLNDSPGDIAHGILPEGENLEFCREALENAYRSDPAYQLGCVVDNDGDRGNIVYIQEHTGEARTLEPQEVFSLAVLSELAYLDSQGLMLPGKTAVAVNGPTSLRIDAVAAAFGVSVFRCEVGEANVVSLAEEMRNSGYLVRILGEGSNGGTIIHPSTVRDPQNTLLSVLKLLAFRDTPAERGLFRHWLDISGQSSLYREGFTLDDILESLPRFTTTGVSDPRAVFTITSKDPKTFVRRYEQALFKAWERDCGLLAEKFDITSWEAWTTQGTACREGIHSPGGVKILFHNSQGQPTDFLWMRKSGTEPVFRMLADCRGDDPERERWLLQWQTNLIKIADDREK